MSVGERACTYACMILHDDGIAITAEKIATLVRSSNVSVELYWPRLFAKLCEKKNLDELIMNIGAAGGGAATDEKEWTIGLPKSLPRDTYKDRRSEWSSDDEVSRQESLLLGYRPRDPYSRETEKAVKLHRQKCTDWYRMRMDEINTPRPPQAPPLSPASESPPSGYMSPEEHDKALAEILEKLPKSSSHDAAMLYLNKKLQNLMDR